MWPADGHVTGITAQRGASLSMLRVFRVWIDLEAIRIHHLIAVIDALRAGQSR